MEFKIETWKRGDGFIVTTDPKRVDIKSIHEFLSKKAYWCQGIPLHTVEKSVCNSVPFTVYAPVTSGEEGILIDDIRYKLAGFARVVTDLATFGYLAGSVWTHVWFFVFPTNSAYFMYQFSKHANLIYRCFH